MVTAVEKARRGPTTKLNNLVFSIRYFRLLIFNGEATMI